MTVSSQPFHFAPTEVHDALLRIAPRRLRYTAGDIPGWQRRVRRKLRQLIALPPNPHAPVRARSVWRRDTTLGTIEKLVFRAERSADVPAYWCIPRNAPAPYLTFICLQGHTTGMHNSIGVSRDDEKTPIETPGDRDFALGCMKRGIAALCIEQRGFGHRAEPQRSDPTDLCHEIAMRSMLLGRTLTGERVFDVDRAIDYLEARGDVDMARLGVMGNSTGGGTSMWSIALLPRVKVALLSCCTSRFADSCAATNHGGHHHCSCNTVPGLLEWVDQGDILAAAAPKPIVIVAGAKDPLTTIESTRTVYREAKRIYAKLGAADRIQLAEGPEGHRFYADLGWAAMRPLLQISSR